jgi:hypothetical protein
VIHLASRRIPRRKIGTATAPLKAFPGRSEYFS